MSEKGHEVNFDGLVGPTHNYSGLSFGNVASQEHALATSHPRAAALQGLEKMWALHTMGIKQAILPPHERPNVRALRSLGFSGSDAEVLAAAWKSQPEMLMKCSSAAAMWTANAATVAPSADTADHTLHITPANLITNYHRLLEAPERTRILHKIFNDPNYFTLHPPLENTPRLSDEGAANHTRFCEEYGDPGVHFFVYGKEEEQQLPEKYPARQTLEACRQIAHQHLLDEKRVVYARQNPKAIDAGVFHNDVISVGNKRLFLYHEEAFADTRKTLEALRRAFPPLQPYCVPSEVLSLDDAVASYLFNSQLVTLPDGSTALIAPEECKRYPAITDFLKTLPLNAVHYFDLRESMQNGGGPACLRLRIVLTDKELAAMAPGVLLNESLYTTLKKWITAHYREDLTPKDLADPLLLEENRRALDALTQILNLGTLYGFQQ